MSPFLGGVPVIALYFSVSTCKCSFCRRNGEETRACLYVGGMQRLSCPAADMSRALPKVDQCARSGTRSVWFLLGFDPDFLPLCHEGCKKKENRKQQKKGIPLAQPSALHSVANCNCRRPTHCRKQSMAYERYLQKNVWAFFFNRKAGRLKPPEKTTGR